MSGKFRAWCFTINNYTDEDKKNVLDLEQLSTYVVCGQEVGERGTPHLQGYVYFRNPRAAGGVSRLIPRAHLSAARGNAQQNRAYCSKDGNLLIEAGTLPMSKEEKGEAERQRWSEARKAAVEGRLEDIDDRIYISHFNNLQRIAAAHLQQPENLERPCGVWYYGPTGTGKSHRAREENPGAYDKMCNKWWDGYQNQEVAIIDDLDVKHSVLVHYLKRWADKYPFLCEYKGGSRVIRPKKIVVTSNYHPTELWQSDSDLQPVLRRFEIVEMNEVYNN